MKRIALNLLSALTVGLAFSLQLSTALAQGTGYTLLTTFTNPAPATNANFGQSVATVGTDRVLIGAPWDDTGANMAGAAYLFNTSGVLLTTFTNPAPASWDCFGYSVAAVGIDRVLIGAYLDDMGANQAGAAYLFSTNGALLMTFTNPTPATFDFFGCSVAAVGTECVLIGASGDTTQSTPKNRAGTAHLFRTDGMLLTTFTDPAPTSNSMFGFCVAAVGADRVLIGRPVGDAPGSLSGTAYLFSTNGALLTTFTNPTASAVDHFGCSVAAVGADRVLIGAEMDDTTARNAGAAYLFSTSGELLTTFANPTPAIGDNFGCSVAALGSERVVIGAWYSDAGGNDLGAAYLFGTNGTLLTTFTNPASVTWDYFGYCIAVVDTDKLLIGAYGNNTGTANAGAAYLFSIQPVLTVRLTGNNTLAVSWPSPSTGWALQQNASGVASGNWSNAVGPFQDDGITKTLLISPPAENRFYRLFKP